jgi:Flp pilus assembly protein TadB
MRRFRISCGATSLILAAVLLALLLRGSVLTVANLVLFTVALILGNVWALLLVDARCQARCDRVNRRMSTTLATHDLDQVAGAITAYRNANDEKGSHG